MTEPIQDVDCPVPFLRCDVTFDGVAVGAVGLPGIRRTSCALPSLQMPLQPNMPGLSSATPLRRGRTVISERSRAVGRRPSCAVIWSSARDFRWIRKHWRRRFTTPSAGQFSCRRFGEGRIGQQPDSTIGHPSRRHRGYRPSRDGSWSISRSIHRMSSSRATASTWSPLYAALLLGSSPS